MPDLWALQRQCAHTFDIESCPRLYVTQQPVGNTLTIGTNEPMTLMSSALAGSFDRDEVHAVLAHEMGHVLADHVGFTTSFEPREPHHAACVRQCTACRSSSAGLYFALLEWSRAAELTADRASALGTGDPLLTCRTLMRMAGGPVPGMNLDAFIAQATEYEGEGDPFRRTRVFGRRSGRAIRSRFAAYGSLSRGSRQASSTASAREGTSGGVRSHRRRPSSTWRSGTTGSVSPRWSSGWRGAAGHEPLRHLARQRQPR